MLALYRLGTERLLQACRVALEEESDPLRQAERCIDAHLQTAREQARLVFVLGGRHTAGVAPAPSPDRGSRGAGVDDGFEGRSELAAASRQVVVPRAALCARRRYPPRTRRRGRGASCIVRKHRTRACRDASHRHRRHRGRGSWRAAAAERREQDPRRRLGEGARTEQRFTVHAASEPFAKLKKRERSARRVHHEMRSHETGVLGGLGSFVGGLVAGALVIGSLGGCGASKESASSEAGAPATADAAASAEGGSPFDAGLRFTCTPVTAGDAGTGSPSVGAVSVDGATARSYYVDFPTDTSRPMALMFSWHGFNQAASRLQEPAGLHPQRRLDAHGDRHPHRHGALSAGRARLVLLLGTSGNIDFPYFEGMLSCLESQFNIDTTRVYSFGFSAGAVFTNLLADQWPHLFAATVSESGCWFQRSERGRGHRLRPRICRELGLAGAEPGGPRQRPDDPRRPHRLRDHHQHRGCGPGGPTVPAQERSHPRRLRAHLRSRHRSGRQQRHDLRVSPGPPAGAAIALRGRHAAVPGLPVILHTEPAPLTSTRRTSRDRAPYRQLARLRLPAHAPQPSISSRTVPASRGAPDASSRPRGTLEPR